MYICTTSKLKSF